MSNEVKRYSVRGQFDHGLNLTTTREVVLASDYAALEAECDKWHQQFNCMQLQRDHHRNTVKALRAELERVRQGSLFLLDAHAELEAARKQEPTHEQMMAGYEIACRYGVYEASAFNLAEAMYKAMVSARPEEIQTSVGEADPSKILVTALRQYMHNDGSGLLAGYEYEETQRIVAAMAAELAERNALIRDVTNTAEAEFYMPQEWHDRVMRIDVTGEAGTPNIKGMVDRFLGWPLPSDVCADPCASIPGTPHRYGTNLLTADQARAMLEHVLTLPPLAGQVSVPRELLERIEAMDCASGRCLAEELRALLATPSMEVKS